MLKKLQDRLIKNGISANLKKSFETCGLSPLNRQQVLKRIPVPYRNEDDQLDNSILSDAVMEILHQSNEKSEGRRKRGRKVNATAGKRVRVNDFVDEQPSTSDLQILATDVSTANENEQSSSSEFENEEHNKLIVSEASSLLEVELKLNHKFINVASLQRNQLSISFISLMLFFNQNFLVL